MTKKTFTLFKLGNGSTIENAKISNVEVRGYEEVVRVSGDGKVRNMSIENLTAIAADGTKKDF